MRRICYNKDTENEKTERTEMQEILLAPATFDIAVVLVILLITTGVLTLLAKYKR